MSDKRPGMDFSEAKKRVDRIAKAPGDPTAKRNLVNSIINQAALREGERAQNCLRTAYSSSFLSGRGTKQTGIGPGKKLGTGRWRYENGKWERVE
jgi:hypothetical protein